MKPVWESFVAACAAWPAGFAITIREDPGGESYSAATFMQLPESEGGHKFRDGPVCVAKRKATAASDVEALADIMLRSAANSAQTRAWEKEPTK